MAELERIAAAPPFNSTILALDTVTGAFQLREESIAGFYDARGAPRPPEIRTSEDWYSRQGYHIIAHGAPMYDWKNPATGELVPVPCIFMTKAVA